MANKVQVISKLKRHLDMSGIAYTVSGNDIVVDSCTISYVDASIQKPMGGIDNTVSPFLGIGIGNPGALQMRDAVAGHDTVPEVISSVSRLRALALMLGFGNDVLVIGRNAGDTADVEIVRIPCSPDAAGVGM